jgi:hypothetical protein
MISECSDLHNSLRTDFIWIYQQVTKSSLLIYLFYSYQSACLICRHWVVKYHKWSTFGAHKIPIFALLYRKPPLTSWFSCNFLPPVFPKLIAFFKKRSVRRWLTNYFTDSCDWLSRFSWRICVNEIDYLVEISCPTVIHGIENFRNSEWIYASNN